MEESVLVLKSVCNRVQSLVDILEVQRSLNFAPISRLVDGNGLQPPSQAIEIIPERKK